MIINPNGQTAMTYGKQTALPQTKQTKDEYMISNIDTTAGKRPKKEKFKPAVLLTREAMEATVNDYKRLKLEHVSLMAKMESEKTAVEKRYEERINTVARDIESGFASVHNYCVTHRSELLPGDRKSFETVAGTVKFYDTPHRVEVRGKETLGALAKRLLGLVFNAGTPEEVSCDKYVREADPTVNKDALLADRTRFTDEQLKAMGVRFEQDEIFAIDLKSDLAEGDKTNAENAA
ncbi:MAG: hypothetical protein HOP33_19165 [Verrucomicrobia bacterium]|nr:hypothetical protein [Verrucomicrobiota bacterium]